MLTRSRSRATNQPVFVDDLWNDAYIQTKDEQIEAMQERETIASWDVESEDDDDKDGEPRWDSDAADSEEDEDEPKTNHKHASRSAGLLANVKWTRLSLTVVPLLGYALFVHRQRKPWPLQSRSVFGTAVKAYTNAVVVAAVAFGTFFASCSAPQFLPWSWSWTEPFARFPSALAVPLWRDVQLPDAAVCQQTLLDGSLACLNTVDFGRVESLFLPCVQRLLPQLAMALGGVGLLLSFHKNWVKVPILAMLAAYVAFNDASERAIDERMALKVHAIDPTFAFVNESIFVRRLFLMKLP